MDSQPTEAILDGETNDVKSSHHTDDNDSKPHPHTGDGASPGLVFFFFIYLVCLFLGKIDLAFFFFFFSERQTEISVYFSVLRFRFKLMAFMRLSWAFLGAHFLISAIYCSTYVNN